MLLFADYFSWPGGRRIIIVHIFRVVLMIRYFDLFLLLLLI